MANSTLLLAIWAIVQVVRAVPGIIWAIRCPSDSCRYRFPAAEIDLRRSLPGAIRPQRTDDRTERT